MAIAAILLMGLGLRLYSIAFGLPFRYDHDEWTFVGIAAEMLANRDPNPHWFGHPGTTTIYLNALTYGALYVLGRGVGFFDGVESYKALYFNDPTLFYLSGRLVVAAFGVASTGMLYLIADRVFGRRPALIAAALLALNPLHVYFSKVIRTDVQMTFLVLVVVWASLRILASRSWPAYLGAGFALGLAVATKYPAVIAASVVIAAHVLSRPPGFGDHLKLFASGAASLAGAFAGSPYLFLDFGEVLRSLAFEARTDNVGANTEGFFADLYWYLSGPISESVSVLGLAFAAAGLVIAARSRAPMQWVFLVFPILFLLFVATLALRWERWVIPVLPFVCALAAVGICALAAYTSGRVRWAKASALSWLLLAAVGAPPLWAALVQGRELSAPETRTVAREWMLANVPAGSRVLMDVETPQVPVKRFLLYQVKPGAGELVAVDSASHRHLNYWPVGRIGRLRSFDALQQEGIEYVVIGGLYEAYLAEQSRYPGIVSMYQRVMESGQLVFEARAEAGKNRGPTVLVYRLRGQG